MFYAKDRYLKPALLGLLLCTQSVSRGSSGEALPDESVGVVEQALEYHLIQLYVSDTGDDSNSGASEAESLQSLMEAQARADVFVEHHAPSPGDDVLVKVRIYVAGTFYGQWFRWRHPYKQVSLELRNLPGATATFYGWRHYCQDHACTDDADNAPSGPSFDPVACEAPDRPECSDANPYPLSDNCHVGYTFFTAPGTSWWFEHEANSARYTGYGPILIQGLKISAYRSAVSMYGSQRNDTPVDDFKIEKCTFYKIGEIANNAGGMNESAAAITLQNVNGSTIRENLFMHNVNYGVISCKVLMHGAYLVDSDDNFFYKNEFVNVSGQPIKFRNGSDRNLVVSNKFTSGSDSVTEFPIQDWYKNWADPSGPETPSFENVMRGNTYSGYSPDICDNLIGERALVCPTSQSGSYSSAADDAGTKYRMIVGDQAYYCATGRDENSSCSLMMDIVSGYGDPPSSGGTVKSTGLTACWKGMF